MQLFDRKGDYQDFLEIFAKAQRRRPIRCLAYCLMPNHFHFVLWPREDDELSDFMFWLTTTHSKHWHRCHGTGGTGHVYQGRFKSIPVSADNHFLRLCRYVECNALRAALVDRAEAWPWSSLHQRSGGSQPVKLTEWPVARPPDWLELIQTERDTGTDVSEIREAIRRNSPLGPQIWKELLAARLSLQRSVRPLGRPKKPKPGIIFTAP